MATTTNGDTAGNIATINDTISSYPGGKGNCYQQIINLIPPHKIYIEPFVGGGAILRNKLAAPAGNIAIDSDASAISQLRSVIANNGDKDRYKFIVGNALEWLSNYNFTGEEFVYAY